MTPRFRSQTQADLSSSHRDGSSSSATLAVFLLGFLSTRLSARSSRRSRALTSRAGRYRRATGFITKHEMDSMGILVLCSSSRDTRNADKERKPSSTSPPRSDTNCPMQLHASSSRIQRTSRHSPLVICKRERRVSYDSGPPAKNEPASTEKFYSPNQSRRQTTEESLRSCLGP